MNREDEIAALLRDTERLLQTRPFYRGSKTCMSSDCTNGTSQNVQNKVRARIPNLKRRIVTQEQFALELDPMSHKVLFDKNLPSICVKLSDDSYREIHFERTSLAFQQGIADSHTIYLCANPCDITLRNENPTDFEKKAATKIKEMWIDRNMEGAKTKSVNTQESYGQCGLLFYYDYKGRCKSRLLSYADGYVIISHNDKNGDRLLECVYYADANGIEHIDCYDDTYMYSMCQPSDGESTDEDGWVRFAPIAHGFSEIPLCTKRGDVGWNAAQNLIDIYEIIYNIYFVIQKRHGWGLLFVKGDIANMANKVAGDYILKDTSIESNGDVKRIEAPAAQGMLDSLQDLFEKIQINSSCTYLLPKDVKSSGDISALAITLTRDLDIKYARKGIIEWQNFADKMMRLFKEGLAKELVNSGEKEWKNAVTDFAKLRISCKFKIWQPFSETEYNNMLISMKASGLISQKTAVEKNTVSTPDEEQRIAVEEEKVRMLNNTTNNVVTENIITE